MSKTLIFSATYNEKDNIQELIYQINQFRENLRWPIPHGIKGKLEGAVIKELDRRGKFLL